MNGCHTDTQDVDIRLPILFELTIIIFFTVKKNLMFPTPESLPGWSLDSG